MSVLIEGLTILLVIVFAGIVVMEMFPFKDK